MAGNRAASFVVRIADTMVPIRTFLAAFGVFCSFADALPTTAIAAEHKSSSKISRWRSKQQSHIWRPGNRCLSQPVRREFALPFASTSSMLLSSPTEEPFLDGSGESTVKQHGIDVRGGGICSTNPDATTAHLVSIVCNTDYVVRRRRRRKAALAWTIVASLFFVAAYRERSYWTPFVNKDAIQSRTLSLLQKLQPDANAGPFDVIRALTTYALGMALWEMVGLSTIPVETAAGMAFGFSQAATASIVGKVLGATLAFVAGRTVLARYISGHKAFAENTIFQLLNKTTDNGRAKGDSVGVPAGICARQSPLLTTFFIKFSCFPELVKNLGCSLVPVVQPWMFVLITALHGGSFSLVWTWLGVDTAARMRDATLAVNRPLQAALAGAMIVGGVLTPMVMAWWMRKLKLGADIAESTKQSRRSRLETIMTSSSFVSPSRKDDDRRKSGSS